jgi:RNA polymerase sigma-70 factor (ECF subfamily)
LTTENIHKFEGLFREFFKPLCNFSLKYVRDVDEARDVVHEVFVSVWEKFESLPADTYYRGYLYTAVRNRCLNVLRDRKNHLTLEKTPEPQQAEDGDALASSELAREVELGIQLLPERCRMVFEMSRRDEFKYAEIAEKMGISVKTVEAQMSKALALLRVHLKEFLSLLFFIFWSKGNPF